jgi:hypothetical protein
VCGVVKAPRAVFVTVAGRAGAKLTFPAVDAGFVTLALLTVARVTLTARATATIAVSVGANVAAALFRTGVYPAPVASSAAAHAHDHIAAAHDSRPPGHGGAISRCANRHRPAAPEPGKGKLGRDVAERDESMVRGEAAQLQLRGGPARDLDLHSPGRRVNSPSAAPVVADRRPGTFRSKLGTVTSFSCSAAEIT